MGIFFRVYCMQKINVDWYIGCSGFSYRDWKPEFYPQGLATSKWLNYYSEHFNSFESNTSFYRTPQISTLHKWVSETPDNFVISVKAPQTITHYKKMTGTKDLLAAFYDLMLNGLQQKLGAVLFQFPPGFSFTEERLTAILEQLEPAFTNVVEFRHSSWWQPGVYQALAAKGICFCSISHPSIADAVVVTAPIVYFRFHGVPDLYRSCYTDEYLDTVLKQILQFEQVRRVYLYFNNNISASSLKNVRYIQQKILALIH